MPNSKRMDELSARLAEVIEADARLDDGLSSTPVVYDSVPSPEVGIPAYRVYVDWASGRSVLMQPQLRTAMQFETFEHTIVVWLVVYNDDRATANTDYGRFLYNMLRILGDETEEDGYWYAGRVITSTPGATHPNIADAGQVRGRMGNLEFLCVQDLTL